MKFVLLLVIAVFISSCNCELPKARKPSSRLSVSYKDFLTNSHATVVQSLNGENCTQLLNELSSKINSISIEEISSDNIEVNGGEFLKKSFDLRIAIHEKLPSLSLDCKKQVKSIFYSLRHREDIIGIHFYKEPQVSADSINYPESKIPVYENEAYRPYFLGKNINPQAKFEFKNGDIMITKGISFVSSTISELATPKSLFSHIVFVHVNEKTKEVSTIESYVGKGVGLFTMVDALKNENARILVLRPKNQELANRAANYMYDRVMNLKKKNKVIPYDYKLDFNDNKKLSCEEVAYDAFNVESKGQFIIPEVMSDIKLKDEKFLAKLGVKVGPMMVPTDMETDSRFEVALDWTDYRVLRDSWRKDAILGEMFRWIDQEDYRIRENFDSMAAKIVWSTRFIPGLWSLMSKISGIPKDFSKDVPSKTISTMASLKSLGSVMLEYIKEKDEEHMNQKGVWMSSEELRSSLDEFRKTHPKDLEKIIRKD